MKSMVTVGPRVLAFFCLCVASAMSIDAWPGVNIRAYHQGGGIHTFRGETFSHWDNPSMSKFKYPSLSAVNARSSHSLKASEFDKLNLPRPLNEYKAIVLEEDADSKGRQDIFVFMPDDMKGSLWVSAKADKKQQILNWMDPTFILDDDRALAKAEARKLALSWARKFSGDNPPAPTAIPQGRDSKQDFQKQLLWVDKINGTSRINYLSSDQKTRTESGWEILQPKTIEASDRKEFEKTVKPGVIFHEGEELPQGMNEIMKNFRQTKFLRKSFVSPNRTLGSVLPALELGKRPLNQGAQILSALPQDASFSELSRMNLPLYQRLGWIQLKNKMVRMASELPYYKIDSSPTKEIIIDVLSKGTNDALILVAHNTEGKIYLSGLNGDIPFEEIANLRRDEAPDRVIILVTCNAGRVNGSSESLAEIMVKNKLAKTVFASQNAIDANEAPRLLTELHKNSSPDQQKPDGIEEVLEKYGYRQIVRLYDTLYTFRSLA